MSQTTISFNLKRSQNTLIKEDHLSFAATTPQDFLQKSFEDVSEQDTMANLSQLIEKNAENIASIQSIPATYNPRFTQTFKVSLNDNCSDEQTQEFCEQAKEVGLIPQP